MFRSNWFRTPLDQKSRSDRRRQAAQKRRYVRLQLEGLEERVVPSVPTTVAPGSATVNFSASTQPQVISVGVTAATGGTVNEGTATILLGPTTLGSATVVGGTANVLVTIPAGQSVPGSPYTLTENYTDGPNGQFANSTANGTLIVSAASTTLAPGSATVNFSNSTQTQNITVGVVSPGGTVNSGTVTVLLNGTSIGTGSVSNNSATVALTIPAGLATSGSPYTLTADYSGGATSNFANSSANGTLTVNLLPPPPPAPPPLSTSDAALTVALDTAGLLLLQNNPNPQPIFGFIQTLIYIYTRQIIVTGGQDSLHALLTDLSTALPFADVLAGPAIQAGVSLAHSLE